MKRIEICGNIASGKTTFCQHLSSKGIQTVFEKFQDNPFLTQFYENPPNFAFETEVTFLLLHYHSIKLNQDKRISAYDYSLIQDIAYADVNLEGNKHKMFIELAKELLMEISYPSKIIHLMCPEEELINRIKERKRDVEASITIGYLKELNKAIQSRLNDMGNNIKIVSINSQKTNFIFDLNAVEKEAFLI